MWRGSPGAMIFGLTPCNTNSFLGCPSPSGQALTAMRHVLSAVVQNVPGVLAHVSGMLASRGYNIDSLAVGETENPDLSRMTFVVVGDDSVLEQVRKQLEKIVTVVRVVDVSSQDFIERDLMLIKVQCADRPPQRNPRAGRNLPRPHRRRGRQRGDRRNLGPGTQDRVVHRPDAALRHRRAGAHRADRHGPRPAVRRPRPRRSPRNSPYFEAAPPRHGAL